MLLNIECDQKTLTELTGAFRFSDAVLRHLVVNMDEAVTEPSPMAKAAQEEKARQPRARRDDRRSATDDDDMGRQRLMHDAKPRRNGHGLRGAHMATASSRRKKFCRFTAEGVKQIDYKDLAHAQELHHRDRQDRAEPHHGHQGVLPAPARRRRSSARAYLALLPYTDQH